MGFPQYKKGRGSSGHGVALFGGALVAESANATNLQITTQPVGSTSPNLATQPVVVAKKSLGTTDTAYVTAVVPTLNVITGSATLGGSEAAGKACVAGVCTFTNLTVTAAAGATWTITFTSGALASAVSNTGTTTSSGVVNRADTYDRADTSAGLGTPSDAGSAWTARFGTIGISSNLAYGFSDASLPGGGPTGAGYTLASSAHGTASVDVGATGSGHCGLVFNYIDNNNMWIASLFSNGAGTWSIFLFKCVAGTWTLPVNVFASGSVAIGSTFRVIIAGDGSLTGQIITSGTTTPQFTQAADAALVGGTEVGVFTNAGAMRLNNFVWAGS